MSGERQWMRYFKLTVAKNGQNTAALDLSDFRVTFNISQAAAGKPCSADVKVYNVSDAVANSIEVPDYAKWGEGSPDHPQLIIDAGYQENHAIIFIGDLWWKAQGRENETDTFLQLVAATGDRAHQYARVNTALRAGSTSQDVLNAAAASMKEKGVDLGYCPRLSSTKLPRGKSIYQMARDTVQSVADTNSLLWAYSTAQGVTMMPEDGSYDPSERVIVLNASSGLLERPAVSTGGLRARALLNPQLEAGTLVQIESSIIQRSAWDTSVSEGAVTDNEAAAGHTIAEKGIYRIFSRGHVGDTRGNTWYTDILCLSTDSAENAGLASSVYSFIPNFQ